MNNKFSHDNMLRFFESASSIIFLIAWWKFDIIIATAAIIFWLTCMAFYSFIAGQPLNRLQKFIWISSLVLGGTTIILNNPFFIKIRSTIVNSVIFLFFSFSHFIGKKTITERLLANYIPAPKNMLRNLNASFACFVLFIACCNYYTAYYLSEQQWGWFSYGGKPIIYLIYISTVIYYFKDYLKDIEAAIEKTQKNKK
jgi:intracellular septation protein